MRSLLAFLRSLTLPFGASTGTRIVLNGVDGRIEFYDAANQLVGLLRSNPTPLQYWGDAAGERIQIEPGQLTAYDVANNEFFVIDTGGRDLLVVDPAAIGGTERHLPRGRIASQRQAFNSPGYAVDSTTDMALSNNPVIAGRAYSVRLGSRWSINALGEWAIEAHLNGSKIGELGYIDAPGASSGSIHGSVDWYPTVTAATDDITVVANEIAGASTLTFIGAANTQRELSLHDEGT